MLRVDAKQGAPKDGNSPLELFQVRQFLSCQTAFFHETKWAGNILNKFGLWLRQTFGLWLRQT